MKNWFWMTVTLGVVASVSFSANLTFDDGDPDDSHIETPNNWLTSVVPNNGTDVGTIDSYSASTTQLELRNYNVVFDGNSSFAVQNTADVNIYGFLGGSASLIFNNTSSASFSGAFDMSVGLGVAGFGADFEWNSTGTFGGSLVDFNVLTYSSASQTAGEVTGSGDLNIDGTYDLQGGTVDFSTVTLDGTLSGTGTVKGDVTVNGTISPGNSGTGTMKVEGDLTFDGSSTYTPDVNSSSWDKIEKIDKLTIETGAQLTLPAVTSFPSDGFTLLICTQSITGTFSGYTNNSQIGTSGYYIHYNVDQGGDYEGLYSVTIDTISGNPTSSGVDLRAYSTTDGVIAEFIAYDVEAEGTIRLQLLGEDGAEVWSGSVEVMPGPQFIARFQVPGLEEGQSYNFRVRDEVGQWWDADDVSVDSFNTEMVSAELSGVTLSFDSLPKRAYNIQWCAELGGAWQVVDTVTATEEKTVVVVSSPEGADGFGFFRIQAK